MKRLALSLVLLFLIAFSVSAAEKLSEGSLMAAQYTITNWAAESGWNIWFGDDLRQSSGSASLNDAKVAEGLDAYQGSLHIIYRTNYASGDDAMRYLFDGGAVELYWDGANTQWKATVNGINITKSDAFSAGDEIYLFLSWDSNAPTLDLDADGTSAVQVTSAQTVGAVLSTPQIGADQNQASVSSGVIAWRVSDSIESSFYNAGAGDADFFVATPDVLQLSLATDDDTGKIGAHKGCTVSAIVDNGNDATLTTPPNSDNRFPVDGVAVSVSSGLGDSESAFIDGVGSDTSVTVDDGVGGAVASIEKVGVSIGCNANYYADGGDVLDAGANDVCMSVWLRIDANPANVKVIMSKRASWSTANEGFAIGIASAGSIICEIDDGAAKDSHMGSAVVTDGKWHHAVGVIDRSGDIHIYIDGVADGSTTITNVGAATDVSSTDVFRIGAFDAVGDNARIFPGWIADAKIYQAAGAVWSAAEILYQATHPFDYGASAGTLTDYWECRDNTGTTVTGNVINLTLTNAAAWSQEAFVTRNFWQDGNQENGGIGGYLAGDAATTISKSTTQVFKNVQSLKILNGDASQAFARQTIVTVANENYGFQGRFFAPTTANGASRLVDVDLAAALSITVTQAGLSAGWNDIEFSFEAADVSTTIDLGSGSVTNAEFGYWDDVRLLAVMVEQPGCEAADGNALPTGWSDTGGPDADETQTDSADQHAGATSILLNAADEDEGVTQTITVVSGRYYTLTVWEKNNSQDIDISLTGAITATIDLTGNNTWTNHRHTFEASTTSLVLNIISGAAGQSGWVDDFSLILLDESAASTAIKQPYKPLTIPDFQWDY